MYEQNEFIIDFMTLLGILLMLLIIIIFMTWKTIYNAKAKERMLIIEKDYDVSKLFNSTRKNNNFPWIKVGFIILASSIGYVIGGITGGIIENINNTNELASIKDLIKKDTFFNRDTLSLLFAYLFAGLGMIFSNRFTKK